MKRICLPCMLLFLAVCAHGAKKALIIANSAYKERDLATSLNDTRLIAGALSRGGYKVTLKENLKRQDFMDAIAGFGAELELGLDEAVFYFSGTGAQLEGENYLLPVGIEYDDMSDIRYIGIGLNPLLERMSSAKTLTVFIDASRDLIRIPGLQQGLAIVDGLKENTFIMFSAAPGNVIKDTGSVNSSFGLSLHKQFSQAGLSTLQIYEAVSKDHAIYGDPAPWMAGKADTVVITDLLAPTALPEEDTEADLVTIVAEPVVDSLKAVLAPEYKVYMDTSADPWGKLRRQNLIDLISGTEFLYNEDQGGSYNYQFITANRLRLQVFGLGAEAGIAHLTAFNHHPDQTNTYSWETSFKGSEFSFAAGLTNPDLFRLVARLHARILSQSRVDSDPASGWSYDNELKDGHFGLSLAKAVRNTSQKFEFGADFDMFPEDNEIGGFDLSQPELDYYLYDPWDLDLLSKWKFKAYLTASSFRSLINEPLGMEGLAPNRRPTLISSDSAFLLKVQFQMKRNEYSHLGPSGVNFVEAGQQARFSAALNTNLGRVVGLDIEYRYCEKTHDDDTITHSISEALPSLRFTIIDIKPVLFTLALDYEYRKQSYSDSWIETDHLNLSGFLVVNFFTSFGLSGFASHRSFWHPQDTVFSFEDDGWRIGSGLVLRF